MTAAVGTGLESKAIAAAYGAPICGRALCVLCIGLMMILSSASASAQAAAPTVELDGAQALADVNRRSESAAALYASSGALFLTGAAGVVAGPFLLLTATSFDDAQRSAGIALSVLGLLVLVGHAITLSWGIALDLGSGARRERLERTHPELRATGGPGDVGLGLALDL
jgi:hypothetical protein